MTDPTRRADARRSRPPPASRKPVLAAWMGGDGVAAGASAGGGRHARPTQHAGAGGAGLHAPASTDARNRDALHETPRALPVSFALDRDRVRERALGLDPAGRRAADRVRSPRRCSTPTASRSPTPEVAATPEEAVAAAERDRVIRSCSRSTRPTSRTRPTSAASSPTSRTRRGAAAFAADPRRSRERPPEREVRGRDGAGDGRPRRGQELIVGRTQGPDVRRRDPGRAPAASRPRCSPTPRSSCRRSTSASRAGCSSGSASGPCCPATAGDRGPTSRPAARGADAVLLPGGRLPGDREVEINPLLAGPTRTVALDARVVVDPRRAGRRPLALRPPGDPPVSRGAHDARLELADGTPVTLRPIRPEDEPLWREMLAASSEDSIRTRASARMRPHSSHELAIRYCFVDYDRELAIVAEAAGRRATGAHRGRAPRRRPRPHRSRVRGARRGPVAGPRPLGLLTDRCVEIARSWGVRPCCAETDRDNGRMLAVLRSRGFSLRPQPQDDVVYATLELG